MRRIYSIISALFSIAVFAVAIFFYFNETLTLKSEYDDFKLSVPFGYSFQVNPYAAPESEDDVEYDIAVYDDEKKVYVWGIRYTDSEDIDFKSFIEEDRVEHAEDKQAVEVSDLMELKLKDKKYEAYTYNFIYTDSNDEKEYYMQVVWIDAGDYVYCLDLEVIKENMDQHKDKLDKIAKSFKEI